MATEIRLAELKAVVDAIFDRLIAESKTGVAALSDDSDFYWEVPAKSLYSVGNEPKELEVGRLSDDWEFLLPLLQDKQQAFPLMLMHVAPLMRYLSGEH